MYGFVNCTPFINFSIPPPMLPAGPVIGFDYFNIPTTSTAAPESRIDLAVPEFDIRQFVLGTEELIHYEFPLPGPNAKWTKTTYADRVTNESPLFVLDCEMCRTEIGELEVTRVSMVSFFHIILNIKM